MLGGGALIRFFEGECTFAQKGLQAAKGVSGVVTGGPAKAAAPLSFKYGAGRPLPPDSVIRIHEAKIASVKGEVHVYASFEMGETNPIPHVNGQPQGLQIVTLGQLRETKFTPTVRFGLQDGRGLPGAQVQLVPWVFDGRLDYYGGYARPNTPCDFKLRLDLGKKRMTVWTSGRDDDDWFMLAEEVPLLTANRFGRGACVYIAASIGNTILNAVRRPQPRTDTPILDNPYAVRLLRKALHHLDIQPSVETTALGAEVVLNRHGRDCVLHVINHASGGPLWVVDSPRGELRGVQVAIRKTAVGDIISATEIVTGQQISIQQNDGWIRFELPPFQVSSSVLLATQSAP